jgi:hypothetical protein
MSFPRFILLSILLLFSAASFAQEKYTLSGYVREAGSGEALVGATVFLQGTQLGSYTNEYGFYSLTVPQGEYILLVSYVGYEAQEIPVSLTEARRLNLDLRESAVEAEEVVITGRRPDENVKSTEMGTVDLNIETIKRLPALFGEVDIMKTIQLLPGIQSAGEGLSGLYVRGGGPDQNLVLLDEAVVYNTGHLFGFFSVFNPDAVRTTKLIKGGMPASYGGRLASVVDIGMKEGNNQSFHGQGGIGIISSRLTFEGPIVKDKSSFMISGRRTYIDALIQPFIKNSDFDGNRYYFYDLNAKLNYTFSDKDRLFLSGYFGRDVFSFNNPSGSFNLRIPWGNATSTLRWNHLFSDKLFMNASVIYNDYNFEVNSEFDEFYFRLSSHIRDINAKLDFEFFPNPRHRISYGFNYIFHVFDPNSTSARIGDVSIDQDEAFRKRAHEAAVYIQDEFDIGSRLKINAGVRFSGFQQVGPYDLVSYDPLDNPMDTVSFGRLQPVKTYGGIEPRLSARFGINEKSSVKASVSVNTQYIHLVSSAGTFPSDIWVPSSVNVRPQRGVQYALGYFRNFRQNMFEASAEIYYRTMENQIEYSENYTFDIRKDYELNFVYGSGRSYGLELFFQKRLGDLTGWVGYTFAFTNRTFPDLNKGETFPATYDRRNDLSVVLAYHVDKLRIGGSVVRKKPISLAFTFIYGTGSALTLPIRRYIIDGQIVNQYGPRNDFRLDSYHRADFSITFHGRKDRKFTSDWVVSAYNLYNRRNPYFIYFDYEGDPLSSELEVKAYRVSVFPIIPSVSWNFSF